MAALYHANNQCGGGQGVKRFCEVFSDMVTLHSFNKAKKVKRGKLPGFAVEIRVDCEDKNVQGLYCLVARRVRW